MHHTNPNTGLFRKKLLAEHWDMEKSSHNRLQQKSLRTTDCNREVFARQTAAEKSSHNRLQQTTTHKWNRDMRELSLFDGHCCCVPVYGCLAMKHLRQFCLYDGFIYHVKLQHTATRCNQLAAYWRFLKSLIPAVAAFSTSVLFRNPQNVPGHSGATHANTIDTLAHMIRKGEKIKGAIMQLTAEEQQETDLEMWIYFVTLYFMQQVMHCRAADRFFVLLLNLHRQEYRDYFPEWPSMLFSPSLPTIWHEENEWSARYIWMGWSAHRHL